MLPPSPPQQPESFEAILGDLDRVVVPGITHWQHPRFFGYFPSNGTAVERARRLTSAPASACSAWRGSRARRSPRSKKCRPTGCGRCSGLSDGVERRHPGHRVDEHAGRAAVRARAHVRATAWPAAACRARTEAAGRLRLGAQPQLGGEGGAARRLRPSQRPHRAARRRRTRCGRTRSTQMIAGRPRARPPAVRGRRDHRHDDVDGARSDRGDRAGRDDARPVAARRCGDGRLGDDPARVPVDVGRRRARRLAGRQRAQVARRGVRLLALLRARSRAPGARDVDQPELPADAAPTVG